MITAIVHTYNAEKHLRNVLEALKDFDEVLVIDNESTDSTRSIAESFSFVRFITKARNGHRCVEPHRQFGIEQASNPWILEVDADENCASRPAQLSLRTHKAASRTPRTAHTNQKLLHGQMDALLLSRLYSAPLS